MSFIGAVEEGFKKEMTDFNVGDTIRVSVKVVEGDKERIQPFDGVVIARRGGSTRETFTVRKISFGEKSKTLLHQGEERQGSKD
jgi:large subunit ribosomal protein L19